MGKRFAIVIGVAAAGVMAASASADSRTVHDPRGDTKCFHELGGHKPCSDSMMRNADIVRARAGHEGTRLRHTIRVVGKLKNVHLLITDGRFCRWSIAVSRDLRPYGECNGHPIRHARVDFHFHSVEISFSKRSIGNPASYGWTAYTFLGDMRAAPFDRVPNGRSRHIEHSLG